MLNLTDFIFLLLISLSAMLGFSRGLIQELLALSIWVIAITFTLSYGQSFSDVLIPYIPQEPTRFASAIAILFLPTIILLSVIKRIIGKVFLRDGPDSHDHLFGLFFGTLRGLLIIFVVVLLGGPTNMQEQQWWVESRTISYAIPLLNHARPYVPDEIGTYIDANNRPLKTRRLILQADVNGHYQLEGKINGQPVSMLVDTGASLVSIPIHIAEQMKLSAEQTEEMMTAAGRQKVYRTTLETVRVGSIELHKVQGAILPSTDSDSVLLGMSFLRRIEFKQSKQILELEQKVR
jgi:aspartyl protease family protein